MPTLVFAALATLAALDSRYAASDAAAAEDAIARALVAERNRTLAALDAAYAERDACAPFCTDPKVIGCTNLMCDCDDAPTFSAQENAWFKVAPRDFSEPRFFLR
jgi:hypothetical protein